MKMNTKLFGEIDITEDKVIQFTGGIIGFPDMQEFMLIHDIENEKSSIAWLQSLDEQNFAIPVIDPLVLIEDYDPMIEDELLGGLGTLQQENMLVLVTLTVPQDITKMTANLKAPIIINAGNHKACQIIVEDEKYKVKHPVYELFRKKKEE